MKLVASFLLAAVPLAASAPPQYPDWPMPVAPPPKPVIPEPEAKPISELPEGVLYVVQSDADVQLLASPEKILKITEESGPVTIHGKFVDGPPGKATTRTYKKKHVFIVERVAAGAAELLEVPKGAVTRQPITDGTPPTPPDPKPPEPVTSFRVIYVYESSAALTPAMQQVMYGNDVVNYLEAKTTPLPGVGRGFRRYDKDVDPKNERDPAIKALWGAVKPSITTVPCVVIEINGKKADILPFPADQAAALALFKQYAEGK